MHRRAGFDTDESVVRELVLWADNDSATYHSVTLPVHQNLVRKMARGTYDHELALKAFMYVVDAAAQSYVREFGTPDVAWHKMFPKSIRQQAAAKLRDEFEQEVDVAPDAYEQYVPKKYAPKWRERYKREANARSAKHLHKFWVVRHPDTGPYDGVFYSNYGKSERYRGPWTEGLEYAALFNSATEAQAIADEIGGIVGATHIDEDRLHSASLHRAGDRGRRKAFRYGPNEERVLTAMKNIYDTLDSAFGGDAVNEWEEVYQHLNALDKLFRDYGYQLDR